MSLFYVEKRSLDPADNNNVLAKVMVEESTANAAMDRLYHTETARMGRPAEGRYRARQVSATYVEAELRPIFGVDRTELEGGTDDQEA